MRDMRALSDWLVCPQDRLGLAEDEGALVCQSGHRYPVVDGIPVMLVETEEPTQPWYWTDASNAPPEQPIELNAHGVDTYVQGIIAGTCGNLYRSMQQDLRAYPIPELRLPPGGGRSFLDVGCNWGRWTVAAARAGYVPVGVDPALEAIRAARRVAAQLGVHADYVVADARRLPFRDDAFDIVFSYSVLQHFAKLEARRSIEEMGRVLAADGVVLVQMANAFGLRNLYLQAHRGFSEPGEFNVRYWRPRELREAFAEAVGGARLEADGFFSLNAQRTDLPLLSIPRRAVVRVSTALRRASQVVPLLTWFADSVYVRGGEGSRRR
jgi:SAM-dependent methyltransferase/uncharacterized protein YbaR (Trm112 family)